MRALRADLVERRSLMHGAAECSAVQPLLLSIKTIERCLKRFWKTKGGEKKPNQTQPGNTVPEITGCVVLPHRLSSQKPGLRMLYVK